MRRTGRWAYPLAAFLLLAPTTPEALAAQDGTESLTEWLNATVDRIVATRLEQTSGSNQTEAPSALGSSTTLVDHASASDLIGLALNPPTFPRSEASEAETTSQTITISPYAILAALTGRSPDDPWFYQDATAWRLFAISLGLEDADTNEPAGMGERGLVVGLKLKVWDRRSVDQDDERLSTLRDMLLPEAGAAYGRISTLVQDALTQLNGIDSTDIAARVTFINRLGTPDGFSAIMGDLSDVQRAELIATVEANIDPFLALNRESVELVSEIRGAPQLSLGFTARLSQQSRDAYSIGVVLDRDLSPGMAWTLNAGLEIREAFGSLEEGLGATFATEIAIALGEESLTDARGARLSLAARGSFMEDTDTQVQVQGKLTVPLAAGLEFPISLTWANRTDLIDESDLFGQIGFSMDTAVLLRALGR